MRGRDRLRLLAAAAAGLLALLVAGPASASSQSVKTYGPARDFGGTLVRSIAPEPSLPVPSGGASGAQAASAASVMPDQILSNELTYTRWAYVARIANIYAGPGPKSRIITRLHWYTEDGFNEIYPALRAHWARNRREWVEIRIPGRPNGRVGWVLRNALGQFHMTHQLVVINLRTERMYFYYRGHRIWSAPVGEGAPNTPTPTGHFWIREEFVLTGDPSNGYYPYAFGTADYSTLTDWPGGGVVGIHGPYGASWNQIPGRISHGCVRLHVPDDFWLGHHLHLGTPLLVK
jgi:hypothetical protein